MVFHMAGLGQTQRSEISGFSLGTVLTDRWLQSCQKPKAELWAGASSGRCGSWVKVPQHLPKSLCAYLLGFLCSARLPPPTHEISRLEACISIPQGVFLEGDCCLPDSKPAFDHCFMAPWLCFMGCICSLLSVCALCFLALSFLFILVLRSATWAIQAVFQWERVTYLSFSLTMLPFIDMTNTVQSHWLGFCLQVYF